jgi:hypothetical protein
VKRILKLIFCALVFLLLSVCVTQTAFASDCKHENTYYEQVKDPTDGVNQFNYHHSLKCADCGLTVNSTKIICYGGTATCEKRAVCESCGEEYGDLPIGHIPLKKWIFNDTHHYYSCANCSAAYEETIDEHAFGIWRTTLSPTEEREGLRVRYCEICGYEQTEAVPKIVEGGISVGLIILLVILAVLAAAVGVFLVIWLVYYKRTMRDLLECIQALGQDIKNMVLGFFGEIVDFCSIAIKSIALLFVKIRAFFCRIGRRIRGFFLTVGIIINRCVRAVKNFFDKVRELF